MATRRNRTSARSATKASKRASKTTTPKAPRERKAKVEHECMCAVPTGQFADADTDGTEPIYESCGGMTTRTFLPGHDARLKGALIRAHRGGYEFHRMQGGMLVSGDPMQIASERGWEHFLKHEPKPRPKRVRKGAKAGFNPVSVKIGRTTYDAVISNEIDDDHVEVAYTDRKGSTQTKVVLRTAVTAAG